MVEFFSNWILASMFSVFYRFNKTNSKVASTVLQRKKIVNTIPNTTTNSKPDKWITRYREWQDYRNKYGGSYQIKLSDFKKVKQF
jgi:hypothetical protein